MQDKIEKIFSYFGSIKNEPFYTSCISQLVQIYQANPQSLKFVLYNLNHLIFSGSKEPRLRLKHRLIAASLVSKLHKIYAERVKNFINDQRNFQLENFQLDSQPNKNDHAHSTHKWQEIDLLHLIQTEELLFSSRKGRGEGANIETPQDQKKVFDSFLDMNHATMLNIENAFKDVQVSNEVTDEAFRSQQMKFRVKAEKISKRSQQEIGGVEMVISNPFNLLFEICLANLLNTEWQLRHLSVLILKQLVAHPEFIGFSHTFFMARLQSPSACFQFLSTTTKELLRKHVADHSKRKACFDEITGKCLSLLSLDRFADYQTDQSIILVRMVGAQILAVCFKNLQPNRQQHLIKMLRRVFDKECPFGTQGKFTWEVKHSFLYFLTILTAQSGAFGRLLCSQLEQSLIKMLASDQVDEVILCICKIIQSFIGQKFFQGEKIDRTNRQVWAIVETLDDISISARDTLRLLLALFPHFKLNQGACIGRLKKFFTSKIAEVRLELYRLLQCLYARKKDIPDAKAIERTLVQLLQAVIVQYEQANFTAVLQVLPVIMPYILKTKNVRKIVEFVNSSVTPSQYTEQIIVGRFLMGRQKENSEYTSNQYLYIYEHESVHCPLSAYTDKRIWKTAQALAALFRHSSQGLQEMIKAIEKNNQKNHRAKILVFLTMTILLPKYQNIKLFAQYKDQAGKLLGLEFTQLVDNEIVKIYLPQMEKTLIAIMNSQQYKQDSKNTQALQCIKGVYQASHKNQGSARWGGQSAKKLSVFYAMNLDPTFLGEIQIVLRLLNNIMKIQRDLSRNIKILTVRYLGDYNKPKQAGSLNQVIKAIMQSIKEDSYCFISTAAASAAQSLSLALIKTKKAVYGKFNHNLFYNVSVNYTPTTLHLQQHANAVNLESSYMSGVCQYIGLMGKQHPQFMKDSWAYFLQENAEKKEQDSNKDATKVSKQEWLYNQHNRFLTLLSGTVTALLAIDNKPFDKNEFLVQKLQRKIQAIISARRTGALGDSIMTKLQKILSDSFLFLTQNYSQTSNLFFQWFLSQITAQNLIFFKVLQAVSVSHLPQIASVASLFILQIIRSITKVALHDIAINCLSNLIVGVYTNIAKNPFSASLQAIASEGIQFIKNFKNSTNFDYKINIKLKPEIDLRAYQIEGINWLGFLTHYNLSGALCDDMGLGKTLQVLVVLQNQYQKGFKQGEYLHSLIVCPTTLMQHWAFQYLKYFQSPICEVLVVDNKRKIGQLQAKQKSNRPVLFITSYSMVQRNDQLFKQVQLKFVVLDQGHLVKNTKTNKYKAVKKLKGLHRFILTGTPIQNRLIELWGLFDFLMPGYLYAEDVFKKHYQKLFEVNLTTFRQDQLLFSQQQRKTLQKLHFKAMPFIMRRMKGDVLRQLPQKIINDYYCIMTPVQIKHYTALQQRIRNQASHKQLNALGNLHEMIKIVNHPFMAELETSCNWDDSGKFIALGELFEQMGFTQQDSLQHNKLIIFAKEKLTIDLIEKYIREVHKGINYRKLTSDIRQGDRFTVAQTFNGDSDIRILLVTKAIGGVGLNLSSANCVVMFDSDYNPTVDMQAIDRAHRIGQKRVLNVYRLITKDTLQEKIMGIQKFKKNLAEAIVNLDNASIQNVKESRLPDLLENVRDLQAKNKQAESTIGKVMYGAIVAEMEANAIDTEEFNKKY